MICRLALLALSSLLGLTACLGSLATSTPPKYFEADYAYQPTACATPLESAVKVWAFSATAPYDRDAMIILESSNQVRFSSHYRWIAVPGVMVSDRLLRDLALSGVFSKVVSPADPFATPAELGGHVFRFAWEESGESARAVLEVEVSLWTTQPKRDILFSKHYRFESAPAPASDSNAYAARMGGLVNELSVELRRDLCTTLRGSSSRAGG